MKWWWQLKQSEAELERELQSDLDLEEEDQRDKGLRPQEAKHAARRALGNALLIKEDARKAWGWVPFERGLQDLCYALRQLLKNRGFTAVCVVTLALAIGGNTAIFSLINSVMLRTLAVKDPARLVFLKWKAKSIPKTKSSSSYANCPPGSGPVIATGDILSDVPLDSAGCSFSLPFFERLQIESKVFSDLAAFVPADLTVNSEGRTSRTRALLVSGDFFSTLGVKPVVGRLFDSRDDSEGTVPSIVVSDRFWRNNLGGDAAVLGKPILIGKTLFNVIGVVDAGSTQLDPGLPSDLWIPLAFKAKLPPYTPKATEANAIWAELIGRLNPKIGTTQATSALSAAFAASATHGPEAIFKANDAPQIEIETAAYGLATLRRYFSKSLLALLAAVGLVLFISCVNIAGLMLARSAVRRKELGMRIALGATRGRIVSQLLAESLLLSLGAGAIGIALGSFGARVLVSFFSRNWTMPLDLDVHPDTRVLAFTFLISVAVGVTFGLIPAFSSRRVDLIATLKTESGMSDTGCRSRVFGSLIVIAQIALAIPVLVAAGLVSRTLVNLRAEDTGFNTERLIVFRIDSTYSRKNPATLFQDLQQRLQSLPGVVSVSRSAVALLSNEGMAGPIFSHDQPGQQVRAHGLPMSSDFLATMGIPLRRGRMFSDEDANRTRGKDAPTQAVVNETLVRQLFGSRDPLSKYFHFGDPSGPAFEIVGVVGDAKYGRVRDTIWPTVYMPIGDWNGPMYFEVRTGIGPDAVMSEIQSAIAHFDRNLLAIGMKTETEQIDQDLYQERLMSALSGSFAMLAIVVACLGLYGLLAFQVARRTQEIGLRIALGAERRHVLKLVLRRGAALAVTGTLLGCVAALSVTRYVQSFLFGVEPTDSLTFIATALLFIAVALAGSYVPARRASKVDPMIALRYE